MIVVVVLALSVVGVAIVSCCALFALTLHHSRQLNGAAVIVDLNNNWL